jgi:hypothetical protein
MMKFFRWRQHKEEELNAEIQSHLDASRSAAEDILTPTTCFVQASCDYGRIKNACQNKLHFSFVSILKATRGYEDKEFQSCGGAD